MDLGMSPPAPRSAHGRQAAAKGGARATPRPGRRRAHGHRQRPEPGRPGAPRPPLPGRHLPGRALPGGPLPLCRGCGRPPAAAL